MITVSVIAFHGVLPFDLSTPCEVFGRTRVPGQPTPYTIRVCGEAPRVHAGAFDLEVRSTLDDVATAHTVMVPGLADPSAPVPESVIEALRVADAAGARIASICTGAFIVAAAGLLSGLRATTHWLAAPLLASRYPDIDVDPNVLFVDNGRILTAAGASAGIDLCLHMVRQDYGASVAADAARLSVAPLERDGGQAQFIVHEPPSSEASLATLLEWLMAHLHEPLTLARIAHKGATSTRTLSRRFREQTGTTPLQWVLRARVRRAQELLEATRLSVDEVAQSVGFESATTLRSRFRQVVGTSPLAYRRSFGGAPQHARRRARSPAKLM